jgi:phage protein D
MPESQTQDQQNTQLLTPSFRILVDGQPLPTNIEARILFIKAESNLEILDMFEVRLYDYDLELINSDDLAIGKPIEIKLGYQESQLTTVATCEIVSWEPEYPPGGAAYLTIRGYDKSFLLSREKKSRSFVKMKDSDIATQIAQEMNLTPHVDATTEVHPYVFQRNQPNLEFLLERAQRINYEMYIEGTDFYFRHPLSDQSQQVTLKWGESLVAFSPRLSSFNQVSEVIVKGWDPKSKKEIIGKAKSGDEHTSLGGAQTATQIAEAAHGATKTFKVDRPIHSQAEADELAKSHFNRLSMNFITGEGKALGDPAIKAGAVIELDGLGDKFSGAYYVVKATHIFSSSGYVTNFEVKKNSLGRPPTPPTEQAEQAQEQQQNYLDVTLKDIGDNVVSGMEYVIVAPDGTKYTGTVGSDGKIHKDNLPPGECKIIFKDLLNAHWEADMVNCGEEIRLLVECPAHDEGDAVSFEIYKRFTEESGDIITTLNGTVDSQSQAEATWTYEYQEEDEGTKPQFVFKAKSGSLEIISDVLTVVDIFEADLKDADGQPVVNKKYILTLPDGSTREGVSNDEGKVLEEELPVGDMRIRMEDGSELEQT